MSRMLGRFVAGEAQASESVDRSQLKRKNVEAEACRFRRMELNSMLRR
jgi:hypothetical protein